MAKPVKKTPALLQNQTLQVDAIPGYMEQIKSQIAAIRSNMETDDIPDVDLPGFGKLKAITEVSTLIKARSVVEAKSTAYAKAAKESFKNPGLKGFSAPEFELNGVTSKSWVDAIVSRMVEIAHQENLQKLERIYKNLEDSMSEEQKRAQKMQEIQNELKTVVLK